MPDESRLPSRPLLEALQTPGVLRDLLLEAAGEEQAAARRLLRKPAVRRITRQLADDARRRVHRGADNSPLAVLRQCGAGCSACCWTPVIDVTPLEAIVVATHLEKSFSPEQLTEIRARLSDNAQQRQAMTSQQQRGLRIRCALLDDEGMCGVYTARPLVCAGVFSLSREACESASGTVGESPDIPLDQPAKAWTMGVSGGLQRALVESGLDGNLYELSGAVLRVLETPAVASRWLRGVDVFQGCLCTDPHSPPRAARRLRLDTPSSQPSGPHRASAVNSQPLSKASKRRRRLGG
ncbi:MAG: YkgJ family cysteine cluster protein [Pirellulaceae bacterium]